MTFTFSPISEEQRKEKRLDDIEKRFPGYFLEFSWITNNESNIYSIGLTQMGHGSRGDKPRKYLLYWKSAYVLYEIHNFQRYRENDKWIDKKLLVNLEIPDELESYRHQIIKSIEEVMEVWGERYSMPPAFRDRLEYILELDQWV